MSSKVLKTLKNKRGGVLGQQTILIRTVDQIVPGEVTIEDIEPRLKFAEGLLEKFDNLQTEIEGIDEAELQVKAPVGIANSTAVADTLNTSRSSKNVRLPKLELTKFAGKYSEWLAFFAMFKTLVDIDDDLSKIEKCQHLRSCLTDKAAKVVEGLDFNEANYDIAVKKLHERFDNKRLHFQDHIREIVELGSNQQKFNLRDLLDTLISHTAALNTLCKKEELADGLLIYLIMSKVDQETAAKWEETLEPSKLPNLKEMIAFLEKRCQFIENVQFNKSHSTKSIVNHKRSQFNNNNHRKTVLNASNIKQDSNKNQNKFSNQPNTKSFCRICSSNEHFIWACPDFTKLNPMQRFNEAKRLSLCINCLKSNHLVRECNAGRCRTCYAKHHSMLHINKEPANNSSSSNVLPSASLQNANSIPGQSSTLSTTYSNYNACLSINASSDHVFLATAVIYIKSKTGTYQLARALLDSASQLNIITSDLSQKLRLKRNKIDADISGINNAPAKVIYEVTTQIKSRTTNYSADLVMSVLPSITSAQPERESDISSWNIPHNLELADPNFNKPQHIDLLIGAEKFLELLSVGQIRLQPNLPLIQKTLFGWIISGSCKVPSVIKQICNLAVNIDTSDSKMIDPDNELNQLVEKFWDMENIETNFPKYNTEQQQCEDIFLSSIKTMEDGRLMVRLPFKKDVTALGNSFNNASRRLTSLERKLKKNQELKKDYEMFLKEYLDLGHMELVDNTQISPIHYYMPHSCVLRPESSSTPIRVVFDASSPTTSQLSLNDILMVGPTVQNDLYSILLRFRCHKYGLTGDVSKMYRQILVYPDDANFQYILWRDPNSQELQTFQLKTVTYGTAAAPYLATRCLNYVADTHTQQFPTAAKVIQNDFYVDDLLTGADSLEEVYKIQSEVQHILSTGKLVLHKWFSNALPLLDKIPAEDRGKTKEFDDAMAVKVLGIAWDPESDVFLYKYVSDDQECKKKVSKRTVLSEMSKLFDPLGLLNPIVVKAKIFLQKLWLLNLQLDESLPQEHHSRWLNYLEDFKNLNTIRIPRFVLSANIKCAELHGFSDASTRAYGGCFYFRTTDNFENVSVNLISGKSKVAPTKIVRTLPCLELCGAELLSKLFCKIRSSINKPIDKVVLWTDSQIVLSWICSHASNYKPFVANRISRIQELTQNCSWRYVPTKNNPADLLTRGATINELNNSIWFNGPAFLYEEEESWPVKTIIPKADLPELKKLKTVLTCTTENSFINHLYTFNFEKTRRMFAHALRFIKNCKAKLHKQELITNEVFSPAELEDATLRIMYVVQQTKLNMFP